MALFNQKGKMKTSVAKSTKGYLSNEISKFLRWSTGINEHSNYHVDNDLEPIEDIDQFTAMRIGERIKYLEVWATTCGRRVKHLKRVHYVNLAQDDEAKFDWSANDLSRKDLIASGSYHTNMKNLQNALNRRERDRNETAIRATNKYPSNRPNGSEYVTLSVGCPYSRRMEDYIVKVKNFLNKYHIKSKNKRGTAAKGFEIENYADVSCRAIDIYRQEKQHHTPIYLLGLTVLKLAPLFHQRTREFDLLRMGIEVFRHEMRWTFHHPKGIKNNKESV
eukprot:70844_1